MVAVIEVIVRRADPSLASLVNQGALHSFPAAWPPTHQARVAMGCLTNPTAVIFIPLQPAPTWQNAGSEQYQGYWTASPYVVRRAIVQWQRACLVCRRSQVQTPASPVARSGVESTGKGSPLPGKPPLSSQAVRTDGGVIGFSVCWRGIQMVTHRLWSLEWIYSLNFEPKAKADRSTVSDWVFLFWSRGFYLLVFPMPFRDLKAIAFHYRLPRIEKSFVIWVHPRSSPALQITQPQTTIQKSQGFGLYLGKRPHTLHVESLWFRPPASPPPPNHLGSSRDLGELLCHASMVSCGNGPVLWAGERFTALCVPANLVWNESLCQSTVAKSPFAARLMPSSLQWGEGQPWSIWRICVPTL